MALLGTVLSCALLNNNKIFRNCSALKDKNMAVTCFCFSDQPISIHYWVYIFHFVLPEPYFYVLHSEEWQMKKLPEVCYEMFAFLKAIIKFSTTKKLFR